jgi:hypothetical protein
MSMSWEQFKQHMEEAGVTDETEIGYIDVAFSETFDKAPRIKVLEDHRGQTYVNVSN